MKLAMKDQIKIGREAMGYTQSDLASRMGITTAAIQHWEAGRTAPKGQRYEDLERVLNRRLYPSGVLPDSKTSEGMKDISSDIPASAVELAIAINKLRPVERDAISALVFSRDGTEKKEHVPFFDMPDAKDAAPFLMTAAGTDTEQKDEQASREDAASGGRRRGK